MNRDIYKAAMPVAGLMAAIICFQLGAVVAKGIFPVVGAAGTTALRLGWASIMLIVLWRPWRVRAGLREAGVILAYGLALGCMNFTFYWSLQSIPLGIAVALEFAGPLGLAVIASRRGVDFLWILLAVSGLLVLLPFGVDAKALDTGGVLLALAAGFFWALYIYFGRKAGRAHGGQTAAIGMLIAALMVVPVGVLQAGAKLFSPALLPAALGLAVLSSALPYSLEMLAMPKLPTRTVGVLMCVEPAVGALAGLLFLGERLSWLQWAAIIAIMTASAGSAATGRDSGAKLLPD